MWGSITCDLQPDMISCAKALSAAMQSQALMVNERVFARCWMSKRSGELRARLLCRPSGRLRGGALGCFVSTTRWITGSHVQRVGAYMQQVLGRFISHPIVGDVRGVGLVVGIEMMADKATRTPFDPARKAGAIADKHARAHGLIMRSIGDRIAFSPPLIITEAEVDDLAARLQRILDATWAELRAN